MTLADIARLRAIACTLASRGDTTSAASIEETIQLAISEARERVLGPCKPRANAKHIARAV